MKVILEFTTEEKQQVRDQVEKSLRLYKEGSAGYYETTRFLLASKFYLDNEIDKALNIVTKEMI